MEIVKGKFGEKVFAICTDNKNKMVKMRKILQKNNPDLITYGFSAHYVNLLENDISSNTVTKHIVEVQIFFALTQNHEDFYKKPKVSSPATMLRSMEFSRGQR